MEVKRELAGWLLDAFGMQFAVLHMFLFAVFAMYAYHGCVCVHYIYAHRR